MSIILIGGEKGGSGKTTLAVNLAAQRALIGRDVLIIDTDIQASASYWTQIRDEAGIKPRVACIQKFGKGLQTEVRDLATRYQDLIIDAGGRDSVELRSALVVAERVYIPIQPSQFDIWTLGRMDELVKTVQGFNPKVQAWVVISRASTNPSVGEAAEAQALLSDFDNLQLAQVVIRDRIAYRKAARAGLGVEELKPTDPKAQEEMRMLFQKVFHDG